MEKKKKTKLIVVGICAAILGVGTFVFELFGVPMMNYNKADELYQNGYYKSAYLAFQELGTFSNSKLRAEQANSAIQYEKAEELLTDGDIDGAIKIFNKIKNYSDVKSRLEELSEQTGKPPQNIDSKYENEIKSAQKILYDSWKDRFDADENFKNFPPRIEIKNTRIIFIDDNDISILENVDYIVEFVIYSNYFYSYNSTDFVDEVAGFNNTVVVKKDGTFEVREVFSLLRSRMQKFDCINEIFDAGSQYNTEWTF